MRFYMILLMSLLTIPALAAEEAAKPPIPIETQWRSDVALDSAIDLMKQKKYSDALLILDKTLQRNVRNADAYVFSAICWANLGNMEKAKFALSNALSVDKAHMGAYVVGGDIALAQGEKAQAEYYLGAIKTVCQGELCPEYQTLRKQVIEAK